MKRIGLWMALAPAAMLAWAVAAWAAPPPDEVCLAGKEVAAGEYAECRLRAEATFVLNDKMVDYEKAVAECDERLIEKFALLEAQAMQAGGVCPTVGDAATMMALVTNQTNDILAMLSGFGMPAICGNGVLEPGEECEWGDLGPDLRNPGRVASCGSVTDGWFPKGTLACNVAECTYNTSDCHSSGCAGAVLDGVCWILGEVHEPCVCACGDHAMVYDDATALAGSAGMDAVLCGTVLDELGVPPGPVEEVELTGLPEGVDFGVGCVFHTRDGRFRVMDPPTTAGATTLEWADVRRACACRDVIW